MYIRKDKDSWIAEVKVRKNRAKRRFATKAEAQRWALDKEAQFGSLKAKIVNRSVRDAFDIYAQEISPTKKGARWEIVRLTKLGRDPIGDIGLLDLTAEDIEAWISRQGTSNATIRRELTLMASVFKWCRKKKKWMLTNVMEDVDRPPAPKKRSRRVWPNEKDAILKALGYEEKGDIVDLRQRIAAAWLICLETGMRQGEIWSVDWEDVYLDDCYLKLSDTKNTDDRDVPLSFDAIRLFKRLGPRESGAVLSGMNQESCGQLFRRAVQLAEVEDMTFHDARHEAITQLAKKLKPLDLARMVGHRDLRSLMIYYDATAKEIAESLN